MKLQTMNLLASENWEMPTLVELPADGSDPDQEEMETVEELKVLSNFTIY